MSVAEYSINNKVISWMFTLLLLIGGSVAFTGLGQLEFPEFTIKQALVITAYPGASPEQVEEEVTLPLENALQQLDGVKHITSINSAGLSQIQIEIKDSYDKQRLPQVWDEMRRKVSDTQGQLPPGTSSSQVIDDFGDVYGILLNLSGDDFSNRELSNYADYLRRELVLVPGVKKVSVIGNITEQVVIEISQQKLSALGLDQNYIYSLVNNQNVVSNAGSIVIGDNRIRLHPTGEFNSVNALSRLVVSSPGSTELIYLGDIARIAKEFDETPSVIYHNRGQLALSLGISFSGGVNVVDVGERVNERLEQLESQRPIGMALDTVYNQSHEVDSTVKGFLINLLESIAIVIAVLLLFMGLRSGLLMGLILLLTILGTFIMMKVLGIELQLISLGALIIALGMLVDNAIVITEGVLIGLQRGKTRLEAAKLIVSQTQWPLLGATVIAIIAFAPIGLSQNAAGEFCRSLFQVLMISLFISWITAITLTPFFCNVLFKDAEPTDEEVDPYKGWLFTAYRGTLSIVLRYRIATLLLVLVMLVSAVFGFGYIKNVFFPASNTPIFFVDVWMPEGTDIKATERFVTDIEHRLIAEDKQNGTGMVHLSSVIGQGAQRFVLPYQPEKGYAAFAQIIIEMEDLDAVRAYMPEVERFLAQNFPQAQYRMKMMENGPSPAAKIEARFYGEDPQVLRALATQAKEIFNNEPTMDSVRHDWRNQVPVIRPQLLNAQARETGISKQDLDNALLLNFSGKQIGLYRETSHLLPIVARAPAEERLQADSLWKMQIWSAENNTFVPATQVVSEFTTDWENPLVMRRDRIRMLAVLGDPKLGSDETADSVHRKVKAKVEAIELPAGYRFEWGGEYESAGEAQTAVFSSIPLGYLAMFLITVLLFNSVRQPLVIWFTVPLAVIGVSAGLLLFDAPFSFMALLGLLSLSGMVIKNGIVLVEQINLELHDGAAPTNALVHSCVSRVRPVMMAAITTMLGMIPLISDAFFGSMAITIIFGLGFASLLTLVVLPVMYSLLFNIRFDRQDITAH